MSKDTNIAWCHHTASPWYICTECSPGCANCYAKSLSKGRMRRITSGAWGRGVPRIQSKTFKANVLAWDRSAGRDGVRRRIFPSLMDWLDPEVPMKMFCDFLGVIRRTEHLDWLLLTKRPDRFLGRMTEAMESPGGNIDCDDLISEWLVDETPPPNVGIGVSVEDQDHDRRIAELLFIPAAMRFISAEPLLGSLKIFEGGCPHPIQTPKGVLLPPGAIHWVIVGGESGPNFRSPAVGWIRDIVDQCTMAHIPVFVKQDSGPLPGRQHRIPDEVWAQKEFPKPNQREEAQAMHS